MSWRIQIFQVARSGCGVAHGATERKHTWGGETGGNARPVLETGLVQVIDNWESDALLGELDHPQPSSQGAWNEILNSYLRRPP